MSDYAEDRFHESLDAALGRAGERERVYVGEAPARDLADVLHDLYPCGDVSDLDAPPCWTAAQKVLASDWLARRIEQAKAEALREAADALEGGLGVFGIPQTLYDTRIWLRRRADEIGGAS